MILRTSVFVHLIQRGDQNRKITISQMRVNYKGWNSSRLNQRKKTFRHFENFARLGRHVYTQIPTVVYIQERPGITRPRATSKIYYYLCRWLVSASFELQTSRPEKCVPESAIGTSLEWSRSASEVCTTLWFVHNRSSSRTTRPVCWLGPEIACDVPVSCRSLRTNPEIDVKFY